MAMAASELDGATERFLIDATLEAEQQGPRSGQKAARVMRAGLSERPVQRAIIHHLGMMGCHAVHTPNGSHLAGDRVARVRQAAALKKDGVSPGFPDLTVIDQRAPRVGFIEVKREGVERLDPAQLWWRDELRRLGLPWALANSPEGGAEALRQWGWR